MGGKHKQAQRTKNNARPSSSGRSAELLGKSINPFVGFSTVKDATLPGFAFASTATDEVETNIDTNFQLVLKKMNKKDATTKLKALQEFTELVNSSQAEAVQTILAFWPRLYALLAVDNEHRVREATHVAHRAVALKVKRNLAPYLKQLAGPWFTSQYDTYPPAATAAVQSFEDAFPANKAQEAILFCQEEILGYICDNITVQTAQTLSNPKITSPEEAEAKYERLLVSSLQGYTWYLNKLLQEQLEAAEELNNRIITNSKFWKLSKTKTHLIRVAWFGCITALCQKAPFLLKNNMQQVTSAVFGNLDETDPVVLNAVWQAALLISNITDCWKFVNMEKMVLPKIWKILKGGAQGSAAVVFPNLLPLISSFPTTLDRSTLYTNFFENFQTGMKNRSVLQSRSEFNIISTSFVECLRYIIMKHENDEPFCESLITKQLIPTIEWCCSSENINVKQLFAETSALLQYWSKNRKNPQFLNYNTFLLCFWTHLEKLIRKSTTFEGSEEKLKLLFITDKHIQLLLCLKRSAVSKQKKSMKVTFASPEKTGDTEEVIENLDTYDSDCSYVEELNKLVYNICGLYLTCVKEKGLNELIAPLCLLIQHFDSKDLFMYLTHHLNIVGDNFSDLYEETFLEFLQHETTSSKVVVDVIFTLLKYLTTEDKTSVLDSLTKLPQEIYFCWCVAKAMSHPYYSDTLVRNWLASPVVTKLLVNIATSMSKDEVSPDESLLLKQALTPNVDGDFYINQESCKEIMSIFCDCLLSPTVYPKTLDACASFAVHLAANLYTETTFSVYGDVLMLALFSFSCNTDYDPEIISKDTLWEVITAWQDILNMLLTNNLLTEFENIMWKLRKIMQNEFLNNSNKLMVDRLTNITIEMINILLQKKNVQFLIVSLLNLPDKLRPVKDQVNHICKCSAIIRGDISWAQVCPVPDSILHDDINDNYILKYFEWNCFVVSVLCSVFLNLSNITESFEVQKLKNLTDLVIDALQTYCYGKLFSSYYITTTIGSNVSVLLNEIYPVNENFICVIPFTEVLTPMFNELKQNYLLTTFTLYEHLIKNEFVSIYKNAIKSKSDSIDLSEIQLTQLFSKYLTYEDVIEPKDKIDKLIVTKSLMHCEDNDVQIAEALSTIMAISEKNNTALFYNKNISTRNWKELQSVIEIIRLLKVIIEQKPLNLSSSHWDFIIISLTSWIQSIEKSKHDYKQIKVMEFVSAVCDLYVGFCKLIRNEDLVNSLSQSCSNFVVEFRDLFTQDVHVSLINTWMFIAEEELQSSTFHITRVPLLESIGNALLYLDGCYLIKVGDPKLPKWQQLVQLCGRLLQSRYSVLQLCGYHVLQQILKELVALDNKSVSQNSPQAYGLMCSQLGHVLSTMQDVVHVMLLDFRLGEDSCRVEPFTDSYSFTFGYLLLWDTLLSFCQFASTELRYQYSDWLKSGDYSKKLLNNIFRLMPTEVLHCPEGRKTILTELFTVKPSLAFTEQPTSQHLEHMVCWVYGRALTHLPALIRQWWSDTESKTAQTVEQVTASFVSPMLCAQELQNVVDKEKNSKHNMKVKVHLSAREVIATYVVDEARMELIITLPANYPLGAVQVDCSKQIGGTAQWRHWVMQLTIFLTHQNGRIWDGLSLWKSNLDKKFEGVEECYICFSVLHNATYQLPKLSCQTCRKKFHSPCLYKWFSTSNKSTCPICRNLF